MSDVSWTQPLLPFPSVNSARGFLDRPMLCYVSRRALRQEAEIHYAMRHENIVEVVAFGLGDADNPPCLVSRVRP